MTDLTCPLQVYLLAEVLKAAQVPSHVLFAFIRDTNIQPRWNDMALPPGMLTLISSSVTASQLFIQLVNPIPNYLHSALILMRHFYFRTVCSL